MESLPAKAGNIDSTLQALERCSDPEQFHGLYRDLKLLVHRLAGSAGSHGLRDLTEQARKLDQSIDVELAKKASELAAEISNETRNLIQSLTGLIESQSESD